MKKLTLEEKFEMLKKFVEEISKGKEYEELRLYKDRAWHLLADITE